MDVTALLKRHAGFRAQMYFDSAGIPRIGYGRDLRNVGVSESEAELMLMCDIDLAREELRLQAWWWTMDQVRRDAIVSIAVTTSVLHLLRWSRLIDPLERQEWHAAADAVLASRWAREVGKRGIEVALMLRTGEWPSDG